MIQAVIKAHWYRGDIGAQEKQVQLLLGMAGLQSAQGGLDAVTSPWAHKATRVFQCEQNIFLSPSSQK